MAEYIKCRNCESPDCKGCNLKKLETMLNNGKFDCLMNENRCINPSADVALVQHGRWEYYDTYMDGITIFRCTCCGDFQSGKDGWGWKKNYCPNCGAKMDGGAD